MSIGISISPFRLVFANLRIANPDVNQCIIRNIPFRKCEEDTWGVKKIGNLVTLRLEDDNFAQLSDDELEDMFIN